MSLTKAQIKSSYPLPVYNYRVTIFEGDNPSVISFAEVTGLSVEHEPVTYRHGFSFVMGVTIIPGMPQTQQINLRKGIVQGNSYLYDWIHKTHHQPFFEYDKRDLVIDLCDETGSPIVRWAVQKAMPVKLEAPGFDANSNDVAIDSMQLIAQGVTVEYIS